ncbi:hypothetical protein NR402_12060 [Acidithiobacillus ferrooxidans]|uniref:hypothetical protein n=1 Tax=Acidithiobacillus ferrooxidans TaxID=920 RepID=UPI00214ADAA1|nr:hypothetical protein [Acidithiobacillus ferrooxidans]MCR2831009.1 hypothetical protein [Acidithiobacillus ferrooxidans]
MQKILDITSPDTALAVHHAMNTAYFQAILRGLQEAVTAHDLQFVRACDQFVPGGACSEMLNATTLAPEILSFMATSVNKARKLWLAPQTWEGDLEHQLEMDREDGGDHVWLMGLLEALNNQGVVLAKADKPCDPDDQFDMFDDADPDVDWAEQYTRRAHIQPAL